MPRVQSRRSFLLGLASIIGLSASHPTRVFAADSNSSVAFTSDLAQDYALSLLPIVDGSANLEIEQIVPVCQQIGLICGYEISVTREGSPYGYLILDASYLGLLKEITLGDTILPISASLSNAISTYSDQQATNPTVLISYNDIEYGTLVPGTRDCVTNYNNIRSVPIVTEKGIAPQSNNPTSWDAVIINEDDLMLHFQIDDLNGIPFRGVSESLVEARTNKYACAFLPCTLYQCITVSPVQTLIILIPIIIKKYGTSLAQQRIRPMIRASSTEARSSQMELFRLKVLPLKRAEHLILNFSVISLNSLSTEQLSIKGISACIICGLTAETVKDPSSYQVIQSR